jgi:hypothetical protein
MNGMLLYHHRTLAQQRAMIQKAHWELYDFQINGQDRKTTIRNIIALGLPARDAIEMVRDCEQEG